MPVSPLEDAALPERVSGIYLGGGFPEVFAAALSANTTFIRDLNQRAAAGMPVYAECGGLIYLCRGIKDFEGRYHPMAGMIPADAVMQGQRRRLGYATARAARDSILLARGETVRGHLFHWSDVGLPAASAAYNLTEPEAGPEGYVGGPAGNLLASYLHLHFATRPSTVSRFIAACRAWSQNRPRAAPTGVR